MGNDHNDDNPGASQHDAILHAMEDALGEYRPGRHHPTHEDDTRRTYNAYQDQDLARRGPEQATVQQHLSNAMVASHFANLMSLRTQGVNFDRQINLDEVSHLAAGLPVPMAAIAAGIAKAMEDHNAAHHQ